MSKKTKVINVKQLWIAVIQIKYLVYNANHSTIKSNIHRIYTIDFFFNKFIKFK
jgi:hypothetical protein